MASGLAPRQCPLTGQQEFSRPNLLNAVGYGPTILTGRSSPRGLRNGAAAKAWTEAQAFVVYGACPLQCLFAPKANPASNIYQGGVRMPILLIIPLMVRTPYGAGRRDYGYCVTRRM